MTDLVTIIDACSLITSAISNSSCDLRSIDVATSSIVSPDNSFCNKFLHNADFSRFSLLKSITIGNDCFEYVELFKIDGLNQLKTIKIGKNSFTQKKNEWGGDSSKSFHILNCESLESIQIGEFSFSDFGGEFELKNLPQLQSIQIGAPRVNSYNFYRKSFMIRGIDMILNNVMIRSSKSAFHYIR